MVKKFLKKIIAQSPKDLQFISACCSESLVKINEIKFLPSNKIFMMMIERFEKEGNDRKKIKSILKFDYIDQSKSKNISQDIDKKSLKLLGIDIFKKDYEYEIILLFSNNRFITLTAEIIEVTLEDQLIKDV